MPLLYIKVMANQTTVLMVFLDLGSHSPQLMKHACIPLDEIILTCNIFIFEFCDQSVIVTLVQSLGKPCFDLEGPPTGYVSPLSLASFWSLCKLLCFGRYSSGSAINLHDFMLE